MNAEAPRQIGKSIVKFKEKGENGEGYLIRTSFFCGRTSVIGDRVFSTEGETITKVDEKILTVEPLRLKRDGNNSPIILKCAAHDSNLPAVNIIEERTGRVIAYQYYHGATTDGACLKDLAEMRESLEKCRRELGWKKSVS